MKSKPSHKMEWYTVLIHYDDGGEDGVYYAVSIHHQAIKPGQGESDAGKHNRAAGLAMKRIIKAEKKTLGYEPDNFELTPLAVFKGKLKDGMDFSAWFDNERLKRRRGARFD